MGTSINNDRTIKVHGHLKDESVRFITGIFVEADIITQSNKAISLPKSAVIKTDENFFVFVLDNFENETYYFDKIKLETGLENEKFTEVLNPAQLKDKKIITSGIFMLSGM